MAKHTPDAAPTNTLNPYLSKGYAPLLTEYDDEPLRVEGEWPRELAGTFYRIGAYNPLDADGMVPAFSMEAGELVLTANFEQRRFNGEVAVHLMDAARMPRCSLA